MPQTAHTAISIRKWVDQFKLIMEHAAADQHMHIAVLDPVQQFYDQIRDILRQSAEMQDTSFLVYDADRPGAEHTRLIHQSPGHNVVSGQQVIYGVGVQLVQPFVNLISVFDFRNILGRSQNVLTVEDSSYLLQRKGVLLNCQRPMYSADSIAAAQSRV